MVWTFYTSYKEHIQATRNGGGNLGYVNHVLNRGHAYRSITDTLKVVKIVGKRKHLHTLEKYHTHTHTHTHIYIYTHTVWQTNYLF
jgi:hypothetical protein